ncbi:MAG: T9SS type A sorting domain-containing protein [Bacteroidales bacterium]
MRLLLFRITIIVTCLLMLSLTPVRAQSRLTGYEYWFNNDRAGRIEVSVTPDEKFLLTDNLDVSAMPDGVNVLNIRFRDEEGLWSSLIESMFYKMPLNEEVEGFLEDYEYWFNNDYEARVLVAAGGNSNFLITETIDVSSLPDGVNVLNIRFRDSNGLVSGIISEMFYKKPLSEISEANISEYEYWFNNNYAEKVVVPAGNSSQYLVAGNIDVSALPDGVNILNIRFLDSNGLFSSTLSEMFFKAPRGILSDNNITAYSYWFDDNSDDAVTVVLTTPVPQYTLAPAIDIKPITEGDHLIHFRFSDAAGLWSLVTTDTITKMPMPVDISVTQGEGTLTANAAGATFQWLDCDNNHAAIDGETDRTFTPATNGNYSVQVTQNGSRDTSSCYYVTTVGIIDNAFGNDIIVYPNPTTGLVTINPGEDNTSFTLSLRDMAGRLIMKTDYKETSSVVLLINERPGIYLLTITAPDQRSKTIRIVKK